MDKPEIKFTSGNCLWCGRPVDLYSRAEKKGLVSYFKGKPLFEHKTCAELNLSNKAKDKPNA